MNSKKIIRCDWFTTNPILQEYHDKEWGKPVYDDIVLFEHLVLSLSEAGLSWLLILKKREAYRKAFCYFDPQKIATFNDKDISKLLKNDKIIRNKQKISSTINNAKAFIKIQNKYKTFANYCWDFVDGKPLINYPINDEDIKASSKISDKLSENLKKNGFKFIGTRIIYAFMQSVGMVNDHQTKCHFK